jgi:hypothetical protein
MKLIGHDKPGNLSAVTRMSGLRRYRGLRYATGSKETSGNAGRRS